MNRVRRKNGLKGCTDIWKKGGMNKWESKIKSEEI